MSLGSVFERGMAYVALSRVRSTDGLTVKSFDASRIMAHRNVKEYYARLEENQSHFVTQPLW